MARSVPSTAHASVVAYHAGREMAGSAEMLHRKGRQAGLSATRGRANRYQQAWAMAAMADITCPK